MEADKAPEPTPEPVSMEQRIADILSYKNLITADLTNDFFIMPFMNLVLKVVDEKGFLSNKGLFLLHQDLNDLIEKVHIEGAGDRDRVRMVLYFTIALNLSIIYISFVRGMEEEDGKKYKELFEPDMIVFMNEIADRVEKLHSTFRLVLEKELPQLSNKYAKVYDEEKRKSFTKDIFPATPLFLSNSDAPDVSNAQEIIQQ
jgi:hypothetical protein